MVKRKITLTILIATFLVMCFGAIGAFAAPGDISVPTSESEAMKNLFNSLTNSGATPENLKVILKTNAPTGTSDSLFTYTTGSTFNFNKSTFDYATEDSRKKTMSLFIAQLQKSQITDQSQQNIVDAISATSPSVSRMLIPLVMDSTSADLYTAMKWVSPILPIIRVIFGIGAIVVSLLLVGSTILDLCFIGLPIAREGLQNNADKKGSKGGKVPFISADAASVVREIESSLGSEKSGYKNAYLIYFKRRVLTYIILSICLLYLIVGELGGLIEWLLSLGSGVV